MGQAPCGCCQYQDFLSASGSPEEREPLCRAPTAASGSLALPPQQIVQVQGKFASESSKQPQTQPKAQPQANPQAQPQAETQALAPVPAQLQPQAQWSTGAVAAPVCAADHKQESPQPVGKEGQVQLLTELPGQRKSLLIGINYHGTSSELSGCVNDIHRVRPLLTEKWSVPQDEASQRVLLDDPCWPSELRPTLANMRSAIAWLVEGAHTGDAFYLHYSGHGGRELSEDGESYHETLCPVDYEAAGMLIDMELFETLVRPLPVGCRLTCVLDCCHSAGVLDLPYVFVGSKDNLDRALKSEAVDMVMSKSWLQDLNMLQEGHSEALLGDLASMGLGAWEMYQRRQEAKRTSATGFAGSEVAENAGLAVAEVVAFTGCRSDQTSADVGNVHEQFHVSSDLPHGPRGRSLNDHAGGALTAVFLESLQDASVGDLSFLQLLERMRERLQSEGFSQVPQLASSLLIELKQRFSLSTVFVPPAPSKACSTGGFDAVDGALVAGGAASAAGFLALLAAAPRGGSMLEGASAHRELGAPHLCNIEEPLISWGRPEGTSEARDLPCESAYSGSCNVDDIGIQAPAVHSLTSWGAEDDEASGFQFANGDEAAQIQFGMPGESIHEYSGSGLVQHVDEVEPLGEDQAEYDFEDAYDDEDDVEYDSYDDSDNEL